MVRCWSWRSCRSSYQADGGARRGEAWGSWQAGPVPRRGATCRQGTRAVCYISSQKRVPRAVPRHPAGCTRQARQSTCRAAVLPQHTPWAQGWTGSPQPATNLEEAREELLRPPKSHCDPLPPPLNPLAADLQLLRLALGVSCCQHALPGGQGGCKRAPHAAPLLLAHDVSPPAAAAACPADGPERAAQRASALPAGRHAPRKAGAVVNVAGRSARPCLRLERSCRGARLGRKWRRRRRQRKRVAFGGLRYGACP